MTRLQIALLQGNADPEETTGGPIEAAGEGAAETAGETARILGDIVSPFRNFFGYLISAEFVANVIAAVIVAILGLVVYGVLSRVAPMILRWRRRDDETLDEEAIARIKRQDTAITLVRNVLRYLVFAVVVLIILSIFLQNILATVGGAAILAAVIGFGAQSFLRDIIAGFSIIFEGQYAVGDFIEVQPQGSAGIVEELGLRMTRIRTLSGEVVFVPNGAVTGVTTYTTGQERFSVEVQLRDRESAERVTNALGEASELYVTPPKLMSRDDEEDGRVRLRIRAGVLPSMSWLVEENLTERIKAAAGEEGLASEPLIYKVDQASLRRIRGLLPQESRRKMERK
ncbi:MAG: mechanosensitive ion channel family protein [Rubrobacteraceae bacterium]